MVMVDNIELTEDELTFGYFDSLDITDWLLPCSGRELNFKIAAITLVLRGYYPSGRQILKQIGSERIKSKVNLNGQECAWKDQVFQLFSIKPYFGYAKRIYQPGWEETLSKLEFKYERGSKGTLRRIKKNSK